MHQENRKKSVKDDEIQDKESACDAIQTKIAKLLPNGAIQRRIAIDKIKAKCSHLFHFFQDEMDRWFAGKCLDTYLNFQPDPRQLTLPFPDAVPETIHFLANGTVLTLRYAEATVDQWANWVTEITTKNQKAVDNKNQKHIENLRYLQGLEKRHGEHLVGKLLELDAKENRLLAGGAS